MFTKVKAGLTYANVIATLALFLALGGGAYAALKLPKGSVGAAQIKKNAVNSSKVKDRSLLSKDFKAGQLPAGAQGAQGAPGIQGPQGMKGDPGPFPPTLPSGATVRGVYAVRGWASSTTNNTASDDISFGYRLAAAPTVHIIAKATAAPTGCSGDATNPGADPGNLCVFEAINFNAQSTGVYNTESAPFQTPTASREGAMVTAEASGNGVWDETGSWAVTAP